MDNLDLESGPDESCELVAVEECGHLDERGNSSGEETGSDWETRHHENLPPISGLQPPDLEGMPQEIGYSVAPLARLASHLITKAHDISVHGMPSNPDHFDPSEPHEDLVGDPGEHMEVWHMQDSSDTCAVVAQEFILEHLLGRSFEEADLVQQAQDAGIYHPGAGTAPEDMGRLLELHGVQVDRATGASVEDIVHALDSGHQVIACIDANELSHQGLVSSLLEVVGLPGRPAGHAVQVIGFHMDDPLHPTVVLNDPGRPDGCGLEVPVEIFTRAWGRFDHFLVTANNAAPAGVG